MNIPKLEDRLYLGTWIQRTSLHLKELYNFLKFKEGVVGLNQKKIEGFWNKLMPEQVNFLERNSFEQLKVKFGEVDLSVTEDGIFLISSVAPENIKAAEEKLTKFYEEKIGSALSYLFSQGAPLPRELASVKTVYPLLLLTRDKEKHQTVFKEFTDEPYLTMQSNNYELYFGSRLHLFVELKPAEDFSRDAFIETAIFYREFEEQLEHYLNLHRTLWGKISSIRESRSLRYRDFSLVRQKLLEYEKTLSFVKARLAQMNDIMQARVALLSPALKAEFEKLGYYRVDHLHANQLYLTHLWEMTIEYADETLTLLDSLYRENTQREISTLKFIALIGAITSFFGMNIAFPWEERWGSANPYSFVVVSIIVIISFIFYWVLRVFIYNRKFTIKKVVEVNRL